MGGILTVSSQENHGSTFSFALPFRVYPERSMSSSRLSDEVYDIMTKEAKQEGGSEMLASTKKGGYYHFTSKGASKSPSPSRSPSASQSTISNSTPPISRSSSGSLSNDTFRQSDSEQRSKVLPKSREGHRPSNRRKPVGVGKPVSLGLLHDSPPVFMDCDSKAPDHMGYIPGLSMSESQIPGPLLKHSLDRPTHSPRSPIRSRSSRKAGKTTENAFFPLPAHNPQQLRQSRILLAEDNKVNVIVAQSMMQRLGHKIEVVNNGAEAIEALQRNSYDVILMVSANVESSYLLLYMTFTA